MQEAYDVLKSPAKKISYDHYLEVCERLHLHPCALLHTRLADLIIVWLSPLAHPCFVDSGRGPASFPVWGIIPTLIYNAGHDPASPSTMADYVPVPEVPGKPPTAQQPRYFPRRTKLLSPACYVPASCRSVESQCRVRPSESCTPIYVAAATLTASELEDVTHETQLAEAHDT